MGKERLAPPEVEERKINKKTEHLYIKTEEKKNHIYIFSIQCLLTPSQSFVFTHLYIFLFKFFILFYFFF